MSLIRRSNVFDPFSLDLWAPFNGFPFGSGRSSSGSLFPRANSDAAAFAGAHLDWKETPEAHVFKADVPGLKKEVKVEVEDGNILQISGERSKEQEEKTDKWHRVERSSGKFIRRFRLPENAKPEQIKASMENGCSPSPCPRRSPRSPTSSPFRSLARAFCRITLI
uniref:SHSP domain-containing protein n=1 Tax=Oryza punctata TaxID=4537 RepID=A0A0E0KBQ4_ORYPU